MGGQLEWFKFFYYSGVTPSILPPSRHINATTQSEVLKGRGGRGAQIRATGWRPRSTTVLTIGPPASGSGRYGYHMTPVQAYRCLVTNTVGRYLDAYYHSKDYRFIQDLKNLLIRSTGDFDVPYETFEDVWSEYFGHLGSDGDM
jgi:hypothetical protein